MRPFNIEEAKDGAKIVTRKNEPVRIICYDKKGPGDNNLVALITNSDGTERVNYYKENGKVANDYLCYPEDLFMADEEEKKNIGYVNVYESIYDINGYHTGEVFFKESAAKAVGETCTGYITTVSIEF